MASINVSRYDILLKPVHENLLKDWGVTVSLFLDDFMTHFTREKTNFSQAALIVQNSTAFYCKRVDVVYKSVQEFVTDICTILSDDAENPAVHKNSDGKKRKKNVKSLEMDDLQLLDFIASDHAIDAKINSLVFQGLPKQIVLCSSMKALRKAGTTVTVYQASSATLGCKDEFRIFGKTYADGTVNEDFNFDQEKLISPVDETMNLGDDGIADNSCGGFDDIVDRGDDTLHNLENPVDEIPPPENSEQPSTQAPNFSTLAVSASIPVATERCAPARPKVRKVFEWEPIPENFKFPSKALKMGKSVYIPSACLDEEIIMEMEQMHVKPRKKKFKDGKEAVDGVKIRWIDEAIRVGSVDLSEIYIMKEREARKQLLAIKHKPDDKNPVNDDDSVGPLDDPEQDDFEAFQDDNDILSAAPVNRTDHMLDDESRDQYADEALNAIEKFKENRRENASRQTDIAKRVAQWHEGIMPKLTEAEARSHLDVHEYGTKILDRFPDDDPDFILPFHEIVMNEPANEICRYVLAMLMLANTYNVEIIKHNVPLVNTRGMYCDRVDLRLLTKVRHHEEMDEAMRVASGECGS